MRLRVRSRLTLGADGAGPSQLHALAEWGDTHSPVACTVRRAPVTSLDVEIV